MIDLNICQALLYLIFEFNYFLVAWKWKCECFPLCHHNRVNNISILTWSSVKPLELVSGILTLTRLSGSLWLWNFQQLRIVITWPYTSRDTWKLQYSWNWIWNRRYLWNSKDPEIKIGTKDLWNFQITLQILSWNCWTCNFSIWSDLTPEQLLLQLNFPFL